MKLFLLSQTTNNSYDTYDSAVVAAADELSARRIHPAGDGRVTQDEAEQWDSWVSFKDVTCKYLGEAAGHISEPTVICSSFNAG